MLFTDMFAQTGKDIGEILHDLGEEEVEKRWNEQDQTGKNHRYGEID